uniref:Ac45-VOA1_TM domain-containing protein n=1 Tax=Rhabditophanes sp. KR3021 TaxID=114890 RepID=A0AC35U1L2_9BILA
MRFLYILSILFALNKGQQLNEETTAVEGTLPVVMPQYNSSMASVDSCLLYMEGVTLIYHNPEHPHSYPSVKIGLHEGHSYSGTYKCSNYSDLGGESTFSVAIVTSKDTQGSDASIYVPANTKIVFSFSIKRGSAFTWQVVNFEVAEAKLVYGENDIGVRRGEKVFDNMNINSFNDYSYACSQTSAAFFNSTNGTKMGISADGIQLQLYGSHLKNGQFYGFLNNVNDCMPSFSIGSWMVIIVTVLLIAILTFATAMLNSIQTMTRFENKAKPININVHE